MQPWPCSENDINQGMWTWWCTLLGEIWSLTSSCDSNYKAHRYYSSATHASKASCLKVLLNLGAGWSVALPEIYTVWRSMNKVTDFVFQLTLIYFWESTLLHRFILICIISTFHEEKGSRGPLITSEGFFLVFFLWNKVNRALRYKCLNGRTNLWHLSKHPTNCCHLGNILFIIAMPLFEYQQGGYCFHDCLHGRCWEW